MRDVIHLTIKYTIIDIVTSRGTNIKEKPISEGENYISLFKNQNQKFLKSKC